MNDKYWVAIFYLFLEYGKDYLYKFREYKKVVDDGTSIEFLEKTILELKELCLKSLRGEGKEDGSFLNLI